ncbi:MAG: hypothetical protein M1837_002918 [Sclerophora amabilis]|nr:MAG: hypothetical protein M1837_002918 [Sclerophora amabilis]
MADKSPAGLDNIRAHLRQVVEDPSFRLDQKLIETFQAQLTDTNLKPLIPSLLPQLLTSLPSLREDPESLVSLIVQVARPLSFTSALSYVDGASSLAEALRSPITSINLLAIEFLHKAASSSSDAAIVAGMKDVVHELVAVFLNHDTAASVAAQRTLQDLLAADFQDGIAEGSIPSFTGVTSGQESRHHGQGLMWRRLFEDRDVYQLFYSLTSSGTDPSTNIRPDRKQRTVSQTRLMGLLPFIVRLDFRAATQSHCPDVEKAHGLANGEGLLDFACVHMVDTKDDVLVHVNLIDFYTTILDMRVSPNLSISPRNASLSCSPNSSAALDFLISRKVHERASKFYLYPDDPGIDPLDKSFLTSRSANYLATYSSRYPFHLLSAMSTDGSTLLVQQIQTRITQALDSASIQRGQQSAAHDLHLLASIPRSALLPHVPPGSISRDAWEAWDTWQRSPVSRIPIKHTHEDFLKTLAVLFHGPVDIPQTITYPSAVSRIGEDSHMEYFNNEASAARALYILYTNHNPLLYVHLVEHAEKVALSETALAGISLMSAVFTANWAPLPQTPPGVESPFSLPTEEQLKSIVRASTWVNMPRNGLEALLCPPGRNTILKYLISPPKTFSNLVGGRGDVESAAYKVAVAKFDVLLKVRDMLKRYLDDDAELRSVVNAAITRGPWGNEGTVGGHIGTLEL